MEILIFLILIKLFFQDSDLIIEEKIGEVTKDQKKIDDTKSSFSQNIIDQSVFTNYQEPVIIEKKINNNTFFVSTLSEVNISQNQIGFIVVTEEANDILIAVKERKNFIIRTVLAVAIVILIFSLFLNKYILNPIGYLVRFTNSIKNKSQQKFNMEKFFSRKDEIGQLTKSIDDMTKELQKRTNRAETFSTDLAHEIRNPLASLKGASELLDKSAKEEDREN